MIVLLFDHNMKLFVYLSLLHYLFYIGKTELQQTVQAQLCIYLDWTVALEQSVCLFVKSFMLSVYLKKCVSVAQKSFKIIYKDEVISEDNCKKWCCPYTGPQQIKMYKRQK